MIIDAWRNRLIKIFMSLVLHSFILNRGLREGRDFT